MDDARAEHADAQDATVPAGWGQVLGMVSFMVALLGVGGLYSAWWGRARLEEAAGVPVLAAIAVGLVAHELLHCVGFLLAGAPRSCVRLGLNWRQVMPFASCSVPLTCRGYRLAVVLPTAVLGIVPAALGVATGSGEAALFGAFLIGTAAGDLLVLWAIRRVRGDALVEDHPHEIGCRVLAGTR